CDKATETVYDVSEDITFVADGTVEQNLTIGTVIPPDYTITPSSGANGTIDPATAVKVEKNGSVSFTITPDQGL
ncbi:MAG: hypothetical protein OMM_14776, partial [Candidatus Magnetoglobus multicellularis str. Araruama]